MSQGFRSYALRHRDESAKIPPKDERQAVKPYLYYAFLTDPGVRLRGAMLPAEWAGQVPDRYDTLAARQLWRSCCRLKQGEWRIVEMTDREIRALPIPMRLELERLKMEAEE